MTEPRIIPWKRIAVEAAAIVVSILLAFAIDAWWAEKKERDVEHEALQALRSDFIASRDNLAGLLQYLAETRTNFARFQSATPSELAEISPDEIRGIVTSLTIPDTFDPVTATLDALTTDGRLGLISEPQLLRHLSNWQRALDDIEANSLDLRAAAIRVRRAMELHGGPFIRWRRSLDDLEVLQRADGEALIAMRQDADFMGKARSHQYALSGYLFELRRLAEILDSTSALLDEITAQ
jgi:hypothetical protein